LYAQNDNTILLKSAVFIFIVFPFISHIYSAVFPALYNFNISNITSVIIVCVVMLSIHERRIVYDKSIIYFTPFMLVALAESIYSNNLIFIKYFSYVLVYFIFLRRFFLHKFIFKLYVNILVITFLILIVIYFLTTTIDFDLSAYFRVSDLQYLSLNSPIYTEPHKGQIFYFLVYTPSDYSGIFNVPRFYGFSREPGMYIAFIIPGFLMACFFKMRYRAIILGFAILITSSFAGYFVVSILLLVMLIPKILYKRVMYVLLMLLMLLVLFRHNLSLIGSVRVNDYVLIMDKTINIYIESVATFSVLGLLFILEKISYLLIIYHFYMKVKIINFQIVFLFLISFVILINKANELVSPLFLFYLSFIDYIYKANIRVKK